MIVISRDLTLAVPSYAFSANNPIIGYQQLVTVSNISATTEANGYPASNMQNSSTNIYWKGASTSPVEDEYITLTLNSADDVDYVGIARHNFGTAGITVSLEIASAGSPEWMTLITEFLPADDSAILMRFEPQPVTTLRIRLRPGAATPRAAVCYAGKLLVLQRQIYVGHTPITMGRSTRVISGRSESGDFLGRIVISDANNTAVDLKNMTPAWFRENMLPFISQAVEWPFFFAWRPLSYPAEVGYAWLTDDPRPVNQLPNGMMSVQFNMEGVT
jgi:hypothetical protein